MRLSSNIRLRQSNIRQKFDSWFICRTSRTSHVPNQMHKLFSIVLPNSQQETEILCSSRSWNWRHSGMEGRKIGDLLCSLYEPMRIIKFNIHLYYCLTFRSDWMQKLKRQRKLREDDSTCNSGNGDEFDSVRALESESIKITDVRLSVP